MYPVTLPIRLVFLIFFCSASTGFMHPFAKDPRDLDLPKFADWICATEGEFNDAGVYLFRKQITLETKPSSFVVHVTADNRYRLFVNGISVGWGPAVSDLAHWNYETIDLAPYLESGVNQLAAQVWRLAPGMSPARQISHRLGFILQGDSPAEYAANTNPTWRVQRDPSYTPIRHTSKDVGGGYIAGPTERMDGRTRIWDWSMRNFDDSGWREATPLGKGNHAGLNTYRGTPWLLEARTIPAMEEHHEPIGHWLRPESSNAQEVEFGGSPVEVPARTKKEFLIDRGHLTMGYPELVVSGGKDAEIKVQYQEALFGANGRKGNRDEWRDKMMKGYHDVFISDGGTKRLFEPLWIRVYRYIKVTVETKESPLTIDSYRNRFTAYPFKELAQFRSSDEALGSVWEASWRTARLCALETYMDCPYYEQLQYIGDTRIQALISYYVSGDDRLARRALESFAGSLQPMGLTKSSAPSRDVQIIPPFSLIYILTLHDFHMYAQDQDVVRDALPGVRFILDWFLQRIDPKTGLLGPLPYWNHVDGGVRQFPHGSPPGTTEGGSANISLLLALALQKSAELFAESPRPSEGEYYLDAARSIKEAAQRLCWDETRQLFSETPAKALFSTHTNSLAVLADAAPGDNVSLARRLVDDPSLVQPTLYFEYYVFEALAHAGLGALIQPRMNRWKEFVAQGLTTFPEHGLESRSDCHAWSAHPIYALLATTSGIRSSAPHFSGIQISPTPGSLTMFNTEMPHPRGTIRIGYRQTAESHHYDLEIPSDVPATFKAHGHEERLTAGINQLVIPK